MEEYPNVQGTWLRTREASLLNCRVEEVVLESTCSNCSINSPLGTLSPETNGSMIVNMKTLVWEDSWKEVHECQLKIVDSNIKGFLYQTGDPLIHRVHSREKKIDFLANVTREKFCKEKKYQQVLGMDKVLMVVHSDLEDPLKTQVDLLTTTLVLKSEIKTAGHEQYVRDLDIFMENKLPEEIRQIQCEMRKSIYFDTVSTTQSDGRLAA